MHRFFSIFERDSLWTTVDKSSRIAPLPLRVPHQSNNPNLAPANQSAGVLFYRDAYVGAMAEEVQTFRQSDSIILRHRAKNISKGIIRKKIVQRIFLCVDVAAQPHAVINPFFAKDI